VRISWRPIAVAVFAQGGERVIAIPEEILRRFIPRKRLAQLLRGPRRGRMVGDGHVDNTPALVSEDHQDEQKSNMSQLSGVGPEACAPARRDRLRSPRGSLEQAITGAQQKMLIQERL